MTIKATGRIFVGAWSMDASELQNDQKIECLPTLYNVCSVHWGIFSTSGGYHDACGGASW